MGRQLRRVPPNWEHPRNESGHYKPLYDRTYAEAARAYYDNVVAWENGTHEDLVDHPDRKESNPYYWDWDGDPPDREYYRPAWAAEEATHYQVYENVSEGTPKSPVFASKEEVVAWLITEGYSQHAAERFVEVGYAFSFMAFSGPAGAVIVENIHTFDLLRP